MSKSQLDIFMNGCMDSDFKLETSPGKPPYSPLKNDALFHLPFIAMAIYVGLTCPITNPLVPEVNTAILAADMVMGRDDYGMRWIQAYRQRQKAAQESS